MAAPLPATGSDLATRVVSALVLAAIALASAWMGGLAAGFVLALAAGIVWIEWARVTGDTQFWAIVFVFAVVAPIVTAAGGLSDVAFALAAVATVAAALSTRRVWRPAGVAYATLFGLSLIELRLAPLGLEALVFVFVVTWATDTGAFFAGRAFGRSKLWPSVSPNKTWAGANGGLAAAMLAGLAITVVANLPISAPLLAITILLSLACQAGDLFESFVKRAFGVKDSGKSIPGHGGLMDRVDGLIFVGIAAAIVGLLHGGPNDIARGLLLW